MKKWLICILLLIQATYLAASKYPGEADAKYCTTALFEDSTPVLNDKKWVIYLSDQANNSLLQFDPIILSPTLHPPLAPMIVKNKTLLARVSLSDIDKKDPHYSELKTANLLLGNNPAAPDRVMIDLRSPIWGEIIVNKLLPYQFAEGFSGICLCNLEASLTLEHLNPEKYVGMLDGAVALLSKIRNAYPKAQIMLDLTGILHRAHLFSEYYNYAYIENVFTEAAANKTRKLSTCERYNLMVERLHHVQKNHLVFTLDLWTVKEKDSATVKHIYRMVRKEGFFPYVAERLDVINHVDET